MSITANMALDLPVPSSTVGPDWATDLNTALETVDSHDHTSGKGVQIPTAGLSLDADLSLNSNSLEEVRSVKMDNQSSPLSGASEASSTYVSGGDLWYTNSSGTAVQVTSGTSVASPSSSNTPAGIVLPYAGTSAPSGYLICDGSAVSRTTYSTLFGVVGTTYGVGDGSTTFNLPNMQGRVPMGVGTYTDSVSGSITRTLAQQVGAEKHVLTTAELASHNHGGGAHAHFSIADADGSTTLSSSNQIGKRRSAGDAQDYLMLGTSTAATLGQTSGSGTIITTQGSDTAHNNMQPSLGLNYIIKT